MTKRFVGLTVVVLVLLLLVGALLTQQIGGVSIRLTGEGEVSRLSVSQPVLRGVPVTISVSDQAMLPTAAAQLVWRTAENDTVLQVVTLPQTGFTIVFPCEGEEEGSLVVRQVSDGRVLLTEFLELAQATQDCALK